MEISAEPQRDIQYAAAARKQIVSRNNRVAGRVSNRRGSGEGSATATMNVTSTSSFNGGHNNHCRNSMNPFVMRAEVNRDLV